MVPSSSLTRNLLTEDENGYIEASDCKTNEDEILNVILNWMNSKKNLPPKSAVSILKNINCDNMLDVGCGLGRILKIIQKNKPDVQISAIDISQVILDKLPSNINSKVGSLLKIPFDNEQFDFVMTTEALEHAIDIENAIKELARVVAKKGKFLIIDKNIKAKGAFATPPWEQWFDTESLKHMIEQQGFTVDVYENLPHNGKDGSDGIYVAWVGTKQ